MLTVFAALAIMTGALRTVYVVSGLLDVYGRRKDK